MKHALLSMIALSLTACGFEIVDTGHRGIKTELGAVVGEPLPEGLHFYNPFTSDIHEMSVRERNLSFQTESFTSDNQAINMIVELVWSIDPKAVGDVYKEVGNESEVENVRVKNNFLGSLKDAMGKQNMEMVVQNRDRAAAAALADLRKKIESERLGILAHSLNFSNLSPDPQYQKAVEQKMVAKQDAETAKNKTVEVEEKAKQQIIDARAKAEAMRIQSAALAQNKGLIEYEYAKAFNKWNGSPPETLIIGSGAAVPFLKSLGGGSK